ncbi:MAG: sporulation transcriptional regulator SpoIIID [Clostridia bacterium]|nr:sporulation transcriptional regulator SpoIIID [Clostridia bacterium]
MRDYIQRRVVDTAEYILATGATVRRCAQRFGVSKTTVHKDMRERLPAVSPALAGPVARVLRFNREDRHIRGGDATRRKYLRQKAMKNPL